MSAAPASTPDFGDSKGPDTFAVVALGGSAGSLAAFEAFFGALPAAPGVAVVVVTHLGDRAESNLVAVLQRVTPLPVQAAADGLRVQPDHVYVLPPGHDLGISRGRLLLLKPTQPLGRRLPIDYFLQSLAKDVGARAVAVVCSGLGSDGAIGVKLVMENFGMVMVQDPATAEFDAMPRAALATGFVDFVLPAAQLPHQLLAYLAAPLSQRAVRVQAERDADEPAAAYLKICVLIRAQTGHDFSAYKRNTLLRRIERRMSAHQLTDTDAYVRLLQQTPAEVELLFKELLIGVTKFFRDPEAFESLRQHLPPLLESKLTDAVVRVWAPGCSTGEEAYSLAMLLLESLTEVAPNRYLRLQLFATDLNPAGVEAARLGAYPENITADVSEARLKRFFTKVGTTYQIRKELRDVVIFALHDLNRDAPFRHLDLLCCRNLLIYLGAELQKNLLPVFHYALNPGGLLFLGPSEHLPGMQELFTPLDTRWKISRRPDGPPALTRLFPFPFAVASVPASVRLLPSLPAPTIPPTMTASAAGRDGFSFTTLVQRLLLRTLVPPAVVIDAKGTILYVNGRTGRYLEPAPGLSGMNLFEMAREELNFELSGAIHRALTDQTDVTLERVRVRTDEGGYQLLRLSVRLLTAPEALAGLLLVVFEEQPTPRRVRTGQNRPAAAADDQTRDGAAALDRELQFTRHRLHTTIEEMNTSVEVLKSTNEELQSANEELQSTNEEAMTNKEEMQSLNEELMTLNAQYLSKTEELSEAANDMKNLLDSTEIAIIFLDHQMVIKRFTPPVARIIHLVPSDVGRPITHFAAHLRHERLAADIQLVLDRLTSIETTIQAVSGEWYALRIHPYRTLDNHISGAVITFTDVTTLKTLENQLQVSSRFAESIVETSREPVLILDRDLRVITASSSFAATFGLTGAELRGQPLASLNDGSWNAPTLHVHLRALLTAPTAVAGFDNLTWIADLPGLGPRRLTAYGRCLEHDGQPTGPLLLGVQAVELIDATAP